MTASKVAAVLNVANPNYSSPYALWHQMRNEVPEQPQTDVQARGHYLEPAILAWWRDQHPEFPTWREHPTFTLQDWAAATPDGIAGPTLITAANYRNGSVLVEAKSDRDDDQWGDPGTDAIPTPYLVQCYWQLHLAGLTTCYVALLGRFLDFAEYVVTYDPEIGQAMEDRCRAFYDSLAFDTPPPLDDTMATYEVVRAMHKGIDLTASVQLDPEWAREYVTADLALKAADARARAAKSVVLDVMGDARYAKCGDVTIARRQPAKGDSISLRPVCKNVDLIPEGNAA
jgi:hypothetical protein